ncbi:MAG: GGDEF domain-containing protein [Candidatus Eremiobacteraeota bacterium]|nr:GGDEF domain-containing protein [Candidatus Eremiobacteraeota bacterium]
MGDIQQIQKEDFSSAAEVALGLLREKVGLSFWMTTRVAGDDLVVLGTVGSGFELKNGDVMPWTDTVCWRMVAGSGPRAAPRVAEFAAYESAPMAQSLKIGSYIGAPLPLGDGKVYGTLAGMDPNPKDDSLKQHLWLVEMVAGLLGAILKHEQEASEGAGQISDIQGEALVDRLTQTFNRRAWDRILTAEEARCARHNHSACVICVDIDSLRAINDLQGRDKGDATLLRTAQVLKRACRGYDIVARTGEDEFAILAVECGLKGAKGIYDRISSGLQKEEIKASLGIALRNAATGLPRTFEEATNTLLNAKRLK